MRILVLEYLSGGGLAGRACPRALAREGAAMRDALVTDLAALPGVSVLASVDQRFPLKSRPGVTVLPITRTDGAWLRAPLAASDAVWLIAPESAGRLARLAAIIERAGRPLLGSGASAIRAAADRPALLRRLARLGVPVPATRILRPTVTARLARPGAAVAGKRPGGGGSAAPTVPARFPAQPGDLRPGSFPAPDFPPGDFPPGDFPPGDFPPGDFPLVARPARAAGCLGLALARTPAGMPRALALAAAAAGPRGVVLLQEYVRGIPASVSVLADGRAAMALAVNGQDVRSGAPFSYHGGVTPLAHPLAGLAADRALAACAAVPGLRGYAGVDLILTDDDAVVVEINPRLTTSYIGLRRSLDANVAALALDAALGRLPGAPPRATRRVRFRASGTIADEEELP